MYLTAMLENFSFLFQCSLQSPLNFFAVKVYKDNLSTELTSKTQLQWLAGETQKDFSGFWVKIFNGERPPKQLVSLHNKKLSIRQVRSSMMKVYLRMRLVLTSAV